MATTPRGVRMVNENIVQEGRGLVITSREAVEWSQIPDGSLYINPDTGVMMAKLRGETDWVPAGLKNDGTLVISRDTALKAEVFTVTSLDNGNGTFTYKNTAGEQRYKEKLNDGYVFQLDNGTYFPGRNHLTVIVNGTKEYSVASGDIEELDNTRFKVKGQILRNDKLVIKYIQWVKIGNPYPRIFESYEEPEGAEVGDWWVDLDGNLQGNEPLNDDWVERTISWENITGKPTTIAGYGITDEISSSNHDHSISQITGLSQQLSNILSSINDLNTRTTNNTNTIASQAATIASHTSTITQLQNNMASLSTQVSTLDNRITAVQNEERSGISSLQNDIQTVNNRIDSSNTQITSNKNRILALENAMGSASSVKIIAY